MTLLREIAALRRFAGPPASRHSQDEHLSQGGSPLRGFQCELCSAGTGERHPHLFEVESRTVVCACAACATLLEGGARRFRPIPQRARAVGRIDDAVWEALALPVHLVFFVRSSTAERVIALYPSPAGATESLLPLGAWDDLVRDLPELDSMQPDVEALLVHRVGAARDHLIVPIDRCYALVGLVRARRGAILGGEALAGVVRAFVDDLCPT